MTVRAVPMQAYAVSQDHEWATICLRDWEQRKSAQDASARPYFGGEILIHSSFGSWAHGWSACAVPFRQFLLDCDFDYVFGKFMGHDLEVFDGQGSVQALLREVLQRRRARKLPAEEARELWSAVTAIESYLCSSEQAFIEGCQQLWQEFEDSSGTLRATAKGLFDESWDRVCRKASPAATHFWDELWAPFLEQLRLELAAGRDEEPCSPATQAA